MVKSKGKAKSKTSKTVKKVPSQTEEVPRQTEEEAPSQTVNTLQNGYNNIVLEDNDGESQQNEELAEHPEEAQKEEPTQQPEVVKNNTEQPKVEQHKNMYSVKNNSECGENEKSAAKMVPESSGSEIISTGIAKPLSKSRKRKTPEEVSVKDPKIAPVNVKAKKQKVVLDIPQANTIPGTVFVIGENDVGQLGLGEDVELQKRPALLNLSQSIVDIAAGGMHSVCLTESGQVITFGCNDEGALGRVTPDDKAEQTPDRVAIPERVIKISAGDSHSAALTETGQVYLWGNFRSGDGPMGLTTDLSKQVTPIKILENVKIAKIASGSDHLVCLSTEGVVYTCGCGQVGQLGRINERNCQNGGRQGLAALLVPGVVHITKSGRPVCIDEVWTGCYATFLKKHGSSSIYACGLNNYNQLGYENDENKTVAFQPKEVPSFNTNLQGDIWLQVSGGQHHTLALDDKGFVYAIGRTEYGRLGLGEASGDASKPTVIPTLQNEKCVDISCGNCVSFAVTDQGSAYSWGMGDNHQLGHGNDQDCHIPHLIEGNFLNSWKALKVEGGGQHTLILACPKENRRK